LSQLTHQYGSAKDKTPNFWKQVIEQRWGDAVNNLRNFGDSYPTRRNKEANLLQSVVIANSGISGGTITTKEVALEVDPKDETAVDNTVIDETVKEKETELAVGDVPVEVPVQEVLSYTKEEVDAKLDEIYKIIADLKAEDIASEEVEVPVEQTKLSIHDRFAQFNKFYVNAKVDL
jgi:hypothetical protein